MNLRRISAFLVSLVSMLVFPWWLTTVLIVGFIVYFPYYIEAVFFGFMIDVLYSSGFSWQYYFGFSSLALVLLSSLLRKYIRI